MMMDFKGTWRTRSGHVATVDYEKHDNWWGHVAGNSGDDYVFWNLDGRCENTVAVGEESKRLDCYDLMERISDRWSKERSGE